MTGKRTDLDDFDSSSHRSKNIDSLITMIAITHIITGILTIPIVYTIFTYEQTQGPVWYMFLVMIEVPILAITIPLYFMLGISIWLGREWVWKIAAITNVICLIFNVFEQIILTAILNIILLLALNNTDVRDALQHAYQ